MSDTILPNLAGYIRPLAELRHGFPVSLKWRFEAACNLATVGRPIVDFGCVSANLIG